MTQYEDQPIKSELLTYVIKKAVSAFYTLEEIVNAKALVWQLYADMLPPERRRVTSDKRSAYDASLTDITGALNELDINGKLPTDKFYAQQLDRMPRFAPEENNVMAVMDRLRAIELQLHEVQDLSLNNRDNITKMKAAKHDQNSSVANGTARTGEGCLLQRVYNEGLQRRSYSSVDLAELPAPVTAITAHQKQSAAATVSRPLPNERRSADSASEFELQSRERRRVQRKQTKVVVGTKASNGRLRGAQAPGRDLFVYRVDKEVTTL